jgi:hypothetical protein
MMVDKQKGDSFFMLVLECYDLNKYLALKPSRY